MRPPWQICIECLEDLGLRPTSPFVGRSKSRQRLRVGAPTRSAYAKASADKVTLLTRPSFSEGGRARSRCARRPPHKGEVKNGT